MIALVAVLALCVQPVLAAKPKRLCAFCGKRIGPEFVEVAGQYYHWNHVMCRICGNRVRGSWIVYEGSPVHDSCYRAYAAPRCAACDGEIRGEYVPVGELKYHTACWEKHLAPRCAACGEILRDRIVSHEGRDYHPPCYQQQFGLRCAHCGGFIEGGYLTDDWGNRYHASHKEDAPLCEYCGRFISEHLTHGGARYDDGRHVCGLCRGSAIDDAIQATALLQEVAGRLESIGLRVNHRNIRLHLVSREQMREFGDLKHVRLGHTAFRSRSVSSPAGPRRIVDVDVYIQHGMPRAIAIGALAHELTHVWRLSHREGRIDPALDEGSCNHVAALVLQHYPGELTERFLKNMADDPDHAYGEGYLRARRLAEEKGLPALLTVLRTSDTFPPGY